VYLADQLNIRPDQFKGYPHDRDTWDNHRSLARRHLGWRECGEEARQRLLIWLIEQAQQHDRIWVHRVPVHASREASSPAPAAASGSDLARAAVHGLAAGAAQTRQKGLPGSRMMI